MFPDPDGRLFNERIEGAIDNLVEQVHYSSGGAFGEHGHTVMIGDCATCRDLCNEVRQTLGKVLLPLIAVQYDGERQP